MLQWFAFLKYLTRLFFANQPLSEDAKLIYDVADLQGQIAGIWVLLDHVKSYLR